MDSFHESDVKVSIYFELSVRLLGVFFIHLRHIRTIKKKYYVKRERLRVIIRKGYFGRKD